MRIKATVKGNDKFKAKMKKLDGLAPDFLNELLFEAGLKIHENTLRGLASRSAGQKQTRYNPKREVIASKPGDAPNTDQGTLIKSIRLEVDPSRGKAAVGTNLPYAKALEYGSTKRKIEPRPFMRPALDKFAKSQMGKLFKITAPKVFDEKVGRKLK